MVLPLITGNKKPTILLIGATGMLAERFIAEHQARYTIIGVSRNIPLNPHPAVTYWQADISTDSEMLVQRIAEEIDQLDVVIHNAVFYDIAPIIEKDPAVFTKEVTTNLIGPLTFNNLLLKKVWHKPMFKSGTDRCIVHITSGSGLSIIANQGQATYSALKTALNMLGKHMALEYEPLGVRVTVLAPGMLTDEPTMQTTVKELASMIDDPTSRGEIRATNGTHVQLY